MSVKTKVGFWWTREGSLAFMITRHGDGDYPWIGVIITDRGANRHYWSDGGRWGSNLEPIDLVEYIGMTYPGVNQRPKLEPTWVPWSFADNLLGLQIKSKEPSNWKGILTEQDATEVWTPVKRISYAGLFEYYEQLDGTPCGKQV